VAVTNYVTKEISYYEVSLIWEEVSAEKFIQGFESGCLDVPRAGVHQWEVEPVSLLQPLYEFC
jgi:hypothetical protein